MQLTVLHHAEFINTEICLMSRLADRTTQTVPFHAVELFKEASALQAQGRDIISLGIGEPDFTAPDTVVRALQKAAEQGLSQYTAPAGIPALREKIAQYYEQQFGAYVSPRRILITAGASGALSLSCMALINPGDEVLMPDPCYPANRNFITAAGGQARLIPCSAKNRFQLTAADIQAHWGPHTRGVLIASPSNPTGTSISRTELQALIQAVRERNGFIIMDEIYLGLHYENQAKSALSLDDNIIIINSFSKYFHMTGWRLGWVILPEFMLEATERMAASLAICAPALAQHAALACFDSPAMEIYEERRLAFKARRDFLLPALEELGLHVPAKPDGAFYIYADISRFSPSSSDFSHRLLHEAGVAVVPGLDFGPAHADKMVRLAYSTQMEKLEQVIARLQTFLSKAY